MYGEIKKFAQFLQQYFDIVMGTSIDISNRQHLRKAVKLWASTKSSEWALTKIKAQAFKTLGPGSI